MSILLRNGNKQVAYTTSIGRFSYVQRKELIHSLLVLERNDILDIFARYHKSRENSVYSVTVASLPIYFLIDSYNNIFRLYFRMQPLFGNVVIMKIRLHLSRPYFHHLFHIHTPRVEQSISCLPLVDDCLVQTVALFPEYKVCK